MLACLMLVALPGCSGCSNSQTPEELAKQEQAEKERLEKERLEKEKKKKEQPVDDFTIGGLMVEPYETQLSSRAVKPGHWVGVSQSMQANRVDFQGDVNWQLVDSNGQPQTIPRVPTSYTLRTSRPLSLAVQKPPAAKQIETTILIPAGIADVRYAGQLDASTMGLRWPLMTQPFRFLPPHEYYLVVLAHEPTRYSFLKRCDAVVPRIGDEYTTRLAYYNVLMPPENKPVPLSPNSLTWTSIAYLVWDDMLPSRLTDKQQQALVEWLHWGGQLIVSGPESLDSLRGSFLAPYLPAEATGTDTVDAAALKLISEAWTPPDPRGHARPLAAIKPWPIVTLKPRDVPGSLIVASAENGRPLVIEGNVGRGRIAVTAFRLRERELTIWPAFDNFFNGCLLRRDARVFSLDGPQQKLQVTWDGHADEMLDPRRVTSLRLFSRDTGYSFTPISESDDQPAGGVPMYPGGFRIQNNNPGPPPEILPPASLGAWNDNGPVPRAARETIQDAAGIEIPSPSFVMWVLVGYLAVLVPLNWTIFKLIRRIEWAWIAAPIIAVAGAALVVRLAELDIGFARSRTEIAVLETQPDYAAGHLTRFVALYTSLSTPYTVEMDEAGALVQPFSTGDSSSGAQPAGGSSGTIDEIDFRRDEKVTMRGFHVLSNRADLIRSEQMIDLGGPVALVTAKGDKLEVVNRTHFPIRGAVAVRRGKGDTWEAGWLGDVAAGKTAEAEFKLIPRDALVARWQTGVQDAVATTRGSLNLGRLMQLGLNQHEIAPGDVRLFGAITDRPLPGLTIRPTSSQLRSATLVVANLAYGPRAAPRRDRNARTDIIAKRNAPDPQPDDAVPPEGLPPEDGVTPKNLP
ncbi:MAG: hypothetical protein K8T25_07730 [Planctomycetia bacterium]|nr:hypothetical protein [Planctomycetia bacterium]